MDFWKQTILSLGFFSLAPIVFASDCSPIRLDTPGGSMEHVPVTDQGAIGICFAHASAQLIDAYRFSQKTPKGDRNFQHRTSPLASAVAIQEGWVKRNKDDFFFEGGDTCESLQTTVRNGSCSDSEIYQTVFQEQPHNYTRTVFGFQHQLNMDNAFQQINNNEQIALYGTNKDKKPTADCPTTSPAIAELPVISRELMSKAIAGSTQPQAFREKVQNACKAKQAIPAISCNRARKSKELQPQELENIIQQRFNQTAPIQPVAISYCASVLREGKSYQGIKRTEANNQIQSIALAKNCEPHASLVIGRRMHAGKCQMLVRNSWGTSCAPYAKDWQCENGNIWVDADILTKNAFDLQYIE